MKWKLNDQRVLPLLLVASIAVLAALSGCSTGSGSLSVVVTFDGEPIPARTALPVNVDIATCSDRVFDENIIVDSNTRGLKNVVVRLEGRWEGQLPKTNIVISNEACLFVPHVAVTTKGSSLKITNEDPIFHTTTATFFGKTYFEISLVAGEAPPPPRSMSQAGLIELTCNLHAWMKGYIYVHDNPFIALSNETGKLILENIPPGTYDLESWHEGLGKKRHEVEIVGGKETTLKISYGKGSSS